MTLIVIICLLVALIALTAIFYITKYNKFQWIIVKLDKGENNISSYLESKYEVLLRKFEFLKTNITIDDEDFEDYKLLNTKISINKLNNKVNDLNNLINKYMDNNEELYKNETINKIDDEIQNINININSSKKYYNNNIVEYNSLCKTFPSKIIAFICKYKPKDFIDEDEPDTLKILNQDES